MNGIDNNNINKKKICRFNNVDNRPVPYTGARHSYLVLLTKCVMGILYYKVI